MPIPPPRPPPENSTADPGGSAVKLSSVDRSAVIKGLRTTVLDSISANMEAVENHMNLSYPCGTTLSQLRPSSCSCLSSYCGSIGLTPNLLSHLPFIGIHFCLLFIWSPASSSTSHLLLMGMRDIREIIIISIPSRYWLFYIEFFQDIKKTTCSVQTTS